MLTQTKDQTKLRVEQMGNQVPYAGKWGDFACGPLWSIGQQWPSLLCCEDDLWIERRNTIFSVEKLVTQEALSGLRCTTFTFEEKKTHLEINLQLLKHC